MWENDQKPYLLVRRQSLIRWDNMDLHHIISDDATCGGRPMVIDRRANRGVHVNAYVQCGSINQTLESKIFEVTKPIKLLWLHQRRLSEWFGWRVESLMRSSSVLDRVFSCIEHKVMRMGMKTFYFLFFFFKENCENIEVIWDHFSTKLLELPLILQYIYMYMTFFLKKKKKLKEAYQSFLFTKKHYILLRPK